ncbi:multiubiquitin domain-containing protein [Mesorhizobium sp. VK9D]|uniref:multiubiquitin domain-containing protein n=1 Tax=Mesorhizobium australafricanum TaxID=3072311 RepID=UPI002A23AA60|nr:multiubiquitin domain-containing protein [Mesorhizobium sp. VK9D]MDX8456781.1 multiubiquitin domain-containing protein [Mesorhizobium sp. VK9D]
MSGQNQGSGGNQGNGNGPAGNNGGNNGSQFHLIVNRVEHTWATETITGAQIRQLAGSPTDWVVNQIEPGPGEDPEIGDGQAVHLDEKAPPRGRKRFTTRKPATSPGA